MEIRYGIRPIIYDVKQIMDAIQDTSVTGDRLTARGFESYDFTDSDTVIDPDTIYDRVIDREVSLSFNVRAGVLSQIEYMHWIHTFGFADPVSAIYDLTTLTFVIDWVFNVGDVIAAAIPEVNLKTLGAWTVETTTVRQTACVTGITNLEKHSSYSTSGYMVSERPCERTTTSVVRTPRSLVGLSLPRFKLNLNWAKLVDLCVIGRNIVKTLKSNDMRISRHGRIIKRVLR
jgi:hypothetical protein